MGRVDKRTNRFVWDMAMLAHTFPTASFEGLVALTEPVD